ncbi:MAG: type IV pilus modification protein PilV [Gammaproteobacteria bacterium]|nr:type IV pilus modification protein PilV [Gammaproteobacteria bacterium]
MNTVSYSSQLASRQTGFTLIEVLIAGLVLSVGVLGVAGLQVTALKNLQSSQSSGVAAMLANDIADRMWVNQVQALANAYNHTVAPVGPSDCVAGTCTTAELADFDINDWQQHIVGYTLPDTTVIPGLLPSGSGTVAQIGASRSYLITLRWDDDHSGSVETTCPPVDADDLDCYELTITF